MRRATKPKGAWWLMARAVAGRAEPGAPWKPWEAEQHGEPKFDLPGALSARGRRARSSSGGGEE